MVIEAPQPTFTVDEWYRMMLVDCDGKTIGKLHHIYVDAETGEPQFATVRGRFIDRRLTFVPLAGLEATTDGLRLGVSHDRVRRAPEIELRRTVLAHADEVALFRHFNLEDAPLDSPAGHRLVRR